MPLHTLSQSIKTVIVAGVVLVFSGCATYDEPDVIVIESSEPDIIIIEDDEADVIIVEDDEPDVIIIEQP